MLFFRKKMKKFDPEKEKTLREEIEAAGGLEKKDIPAMLISAFLVFMPVALLVLGLFALVAFLFI
jgi:hypothetical protein